MVAAALCMALYNVWSRPFVARSAPVPFAAFSMGCGAAFLITASALSGHLGALASLNHPQWGAVSYLAIICGALIFFLWAFALGRTSPTLVAISVAINPVTAALLALPMLNEPISPNLIAGLLGVIAGIGIAARTAVR